MRALVFHNPSAGMRGHSGDEIAAAHADKGMNVTSCSTEGDDFLGCLSHEARPM